MQFQVHAQIFFSSCLFARLYHLDIAFRFSIMIFASSKIAFYPPASVAVKNSVELHFRRIRMQIILQRVHVLPVLATYVTQPVCFALATLRTKWASELRFFAAFPVRVTLKRVLPHVRTAASGTGESAG